MGITLNLQSTKGKVFLILDMKV